jgi:hypothetical protein
MFVTVFWRAIFGANYKNIKEVKDEIILCLKSTYY